MRKMTSLIAVVALALVAGQAKSDPAQTSPSPQFTPIQNDSGTYTPPKPKKGFRYPDCFCTDSEGKRIELGKMTCLSIGSQQVTARCEMSLNTPIWKRVQQGCPSV